MRLKILFLLLASFCFPAAFVILPIFIYEKISTLPLLPFLIVGIIANGSLRQLAKNGLEAVKNLDPKNKKRFVEIGEDTKLAGTLMFLGLMFGIIFIVNNYTFLGLGILAGSFLLDHCFIVRNLAHNAWLATAKK